MIRRLAFAVTLVPIIILPMLIISGYLVFYAGRWIVTGQSAPDDPAPKWLIPWLYLPDKILGRPLL